MTKYLSCGERLERLHALREFESQYHLNTLEDHRLIGEIGYYQAKGTPLQLKQVFLLGLGSITTIQRRLRRLKALGLVEHRRKASDGRAVDVILSPKCIRILARYHVLMTTKSVSNRRRAGD